MPKDKRLQRSFPASHSWENNGKIEIKNSTHRDFSSCKHINKIGEKESNKEM